MNIHRRLFEGVINHAGKARTYNITKKEWVLKGETIKHLAKFTSDIWQIHPFSEGNTRANYNDLKNGIHATTKYYF